MRIVLITNHPAPYRQQLFDQLATRLPGLHVLYEAGGSQRRGWGQATLTGYQHEFISETAIETLSARQKATGAWAALRRLKPDIVIASGFGPSSLAAVKWADQHRRVMIGFSGCTELGERQVTGTRLRTRQWVARTASGWIAYGPQARSYLGRLGADSAVIEAAGNPYGIEIKPARPLPSETIRVGFVGRLDWRKAWWIPVQALKAVVARGVKATLEIAGDGPGGRLMEGQLRDSPDLDVRWHRHLSPPQMPEFYDRLDLLVVPSFVDQWPIVLSEAAASGVPAVTTPPVFSGAPTELSTATGGVPLTPGSIMDVADAIEAVAAGAERRALVARIARVEREISPVAVADRWVRLIDKAQIQPRS